MNLHQFQNKEALQAFYTFEITEHDTLVLTHCKNESKP